MAGCGPGRTSNGCTAFTASGEKITAFAEAVNGKLDEIALHHGAVTSWKLVRSERPH
jgi:hypothetical protein